MPVDFTSAREVVVCVWGGAVLVFSHILEMEKVILLRLNNSKKKKNGCFRVGFIADDVPWTLGTTSLPSYSFILHEDTISRFLITYSG